MQVARDGRIDGPADRVVEQIQFNLIFAATFAVFLVTALITLLLPWTWRRRLLSDDKKWFVKRAWEDAGTFVELAYMG
jgi:hypothetical protein